MAAAIEHACAVRQEPIVDVFHVLAGEDKDNYDGDSNYQMKPFHRAVSFAVKPWLGFSSGVGVDSHIAQGPHLTLAQQEFFAA